jgi:hypothetical protein
MEQAFRSPEMGCLPAGGMGYRVVRQGLKPLFARL